MQVTLSAASENGICGRDQHRQHNMHLNTIFHKTKNNLQAFWQGLSSMAGKRMKLCDGLPCQRRCSLIEFFVSQARRQSCSCLLRGCCS